MKAYVPEAGSDRVREILSQESIAISALTIAEFASALAGKRRARSIDASQEQTILRSFRSDARAFEVIDVSVNVIEEAARSLSTPNGIIVRTLDAIHLASARLALSMTPWTATSLVTSDRRLYDAALAAGLSVENPAAEGTQ